jgi:arginyl-tRNA--protein-N-Asp/Glu arginylyltransferase
MVEDSHVHTRLIEYRRHPHPSLPGEPDCEGSRPRQRGPHEGITAGAGRGEGELVAVALTDVLKDGLSMVYSFYEPEPVGRSLGTFMILDHVARARRLGLAYVYLGYWVRGSRKMDYKGRFLPQQRLAPEGWQRVER